MEGAHAATSNHGPPPAKKYRGPAAKTFQCRGFGECRMVFSRSEHLARHVRKHTGERPFKCHCGKQFSRLDNLRQHAHTVHADRPEQNESMMRDLGALHTSLAFTSQRPIFGERGGDKGDHSPTGLGGDEGVAGGLSNVAESNGRTRLRDTKTTPQKPENTSPLEWDPAGRPREGASLPFGPNIHSSPAPPPSTPSASSLRAPAAIFLPQGTPFDSPTSQFPQYTNNVYQHPQTASSSSASNATYTNNGGPMLDQALQGFSSSSSASNSGLSSPQDILAAQQQQQAQGAAGQESLSLQFPFSSIGFLPPPPARTRAFAQGQQEGGSPQDQAFRSSPSRSDLHQGPLDLGTMGTISPPHSSPTHSGLEQPQPISLSQPPQRRPKRRLADSPRLSAAMGSLIPRRPSALTPSGSMPNLRSAAIAQAQQQAQQQAAFMTAMVSPEEQQQMAHYFQVLTSGPPSAPVAPVLAHNDSDQSMNGGQTEESLSNDQLLQGMNPSSPSIPLQPSLEDMALALEQDPFFQDQELPMFPDLAQQDEYPDLATDESLDQGQPTYSPTGLQPQHQMDSGGSAAILSQTTTGMTGRMMMGQQGAGSPGHTQQAQSDSPPDGDSGSAGSLQDRIQDMRDYMRLQLQPSAAQSAPSLPQQSSVAAFNMSPMEMQLAMQMNMDMSAMDFGLGMGTDMDFGLDPAAFPLPMTPLDLPQGGSLSWSSAPPTRPSFDQSPQEQSPSHMLQRQQPPHSRRASHSQSSGPGGPRPQADPHMDPQTQSPDQARRTSTEAARQQAKRQGKQPMKMMMPQSQSMPTLSQQGQAQQPLRPLHLEMPPATLQFQQQGVVLPSPTYWQHPLTSPQALLNQAPASAYVYPSSMGTLSEFPLGMPTAPIPGMVPMFPVHTLGHLRSLDQAPLGTVQGQQPQQQAQPPGSLQDYRRGLASLHRLPLQVRRLQRLGSKSNPNPNLGTGGHYVGQPGPRPPT